MQTGPGAAKPCVYHRGYRDRGGDVCPFHRRAGINERIQGAGAERSKRCSQGKVFRFLLPSFLLCVNAFGTHRHHFQADSREFEFGNRGRLSNV